MSSTTSIPVASRVHNFTYAIRNIVAEAKAVERKGVKVRLPQHRRSHPVRVQDAAGAGGGRRARDDRRRQQIRALARHCRRRAKPWREWTGTDFRSTPDRVLITAGTSEGIELALTRPGQPGRRRAGAAADLPALHGRAREDRRRRRATTGRTRRRGWLPDLDHLQSLIDARTRSWSSSTPTTPPARSTRRRPRGSSSIWRIATAW